MKKKQVELMKLLIKWNLHLGYQKSLNKFIPNYILGFYKNQSIIDIYKTIFMLQRVLFFIMNMVGFYGGFLIIGKDNLLIKNLITKYHYYSIYYLASQYWKPGLLTNYANFFPYFAHNILKQNDLKNLEESKVKHLIFFPKVILLLNPEEDKKILHEAFLANIPVIGIVDSNCSTDVLEKLTYSIPANIHSIKSIYFFTNFFIKSFLYARLIRLNRLLQYERRYLSRRSFNTKRDFISLNRNNKLFRKNDKIINFNIKNLNKKKLIKKANNNLSIKELKFKVNADLIKLFRIKNTFKKKKLIKKRIRRFLKQTLIVVKTRQRVKKKKIKNNVVKTKKSNKNII